MAKALQTRIRPTRRWHSLNGSEAVLNLILQQHVQTYPVETGRRTAVVWIEHNYHSSMNTMDHENRRSPPAPLKLRGNSRTKHGNIFISCSLLTIAAPSFFRCGRRFLATPSKLSRNQQLRVSLRGVGTVRASRVGIRGYNGNVVPERMPINRLSPDSDGIPEAVPIFKFPS